MGDIQCSDVEAIRRATAGFDHNGSIVACATVDIGSRVQYAIQCIAVEVAAADARNGVDASVRAMTEGRGTD